MNSDTFIGLINNAALLLALVILYDLIPQRPKTGRWLARAFSGVLLGLVGMGVMLTAWELVPGIRFDTRSVLLALTGLFFGALPTVIVMIMTAVFRLVQGGAGAWTGVLVILSSAGLGLGWRHLRRRKEAPVWWELLLFGIVVHVVMLLELLTLPGGTAVPVLRQIALPVMLIFPAVTVLMGRLLGRRQSQQVIEAALQQSEERFRRAIEEAPFPIMIHADDGEVLSLSQIWTEITGYDEAQIPTIATWTRRAYGSEAAKFQEIIADTYYLQHRKAEGEFTITCADGSQRIWDFSSNALGRLSDGRRLAISMASDITERKEAEQEMARAERLLTFAIEQMPIPVVIARAPDVTISHFNQAATDLLTKPVENLRQIPLEAQREFWPTFYPDDAPFPVEDYPLTRAIQRGDVARGVEMIIRRQDGDHWVSASAAPLRNEEGEIIAGIVVFPEITDLKQAEQEIQALNKALEARVAERTKQLEARTKELEQFAYSVSHDLKAPLRGIDGYSRLLMEDYGEELDADGRFFVNNIRQATTQMHELIEDLLAYSRLERRSLTVDQIAIPALVQAVLSERTEEVEARGVALTVDVPETAVVADREGLTMALRNLLDNALKFTKHTRLPAIIIGGRDTESACTLWVQDNGVGFEKQFHDRIFDIFQRLHRAEEYPGTGIGLALVRKAMERMNGRVWAESGPDQGATFYLEIPKSS